MVLRMEKYLWSHGVRSSTTDTVYFQLFVDFSTQTEVTNFNDRVILDQNVLKLEIPVYVTFVIKLIHPINKLLNEIYLDIDQLHSRFYLLFKFLQFFSQIFFTIFHEQVTLFLSFFIDILIKWNNILMINLFQALNLN